MIATLIILDVFVGILAMVGLAALWTAVRGRRRTAGTKGVALVSERLQPRRRNIARFQATLRIVGPVVRYDVGLGLQADGAPFEASPPSPATRPSMCCDDEELSWTFEVPDDDVDRLWVVARWVEARGHDLRAAAIARRLGTSETYVWKWYVGRLGGWRRQRSEMAAPAALPAMPSRGTEDRG
ncbi:hypothetical protein [Mycobacterium palustre]|uniref:Uncharacterized protein n=1 Tax=Mycobacterium palustre TaxID=153971 RepID=A0A1X1Z316_9MYCO|nr:hypothetical protein [Mycobacterium palustre]MCV7099640.1 hypothetical protein [Mycobacterium palustre]ORW17684.1 hypothetical protein AWC19_20595 [Mycobacterium palustre]